MVDVENQPPNLKGRKCFGWNGLQRSAAKCFLSSRKRCHCGQLVLLRSSVVGVIGWLPRVIVGPVTEWVQRPRFLVPALQLRLPKLAADICTDCHIYHNQFRYTKRASSSYDTSTNLNSSFCVIVAGAGGWIVLFPWVGREVGLKKSHCYSVVLVSRASMVWMVHTYVLYLQARYKYHHLPTYCTTTIKEHFF